MLESSAYKEILDVTIHIRIVETVSLYGHVLLSFRYHEKVKLQFFS